MYQLEALCRSLLIKGLLQLWSGPLCVGGAKEGEEALEAGSIGKVSSDAFCGDGCLPFHSSFKELLAAA